MGRRSRGKAGEIAATRTPAPAPRPSRMDGTRLGARALERPPAPWDPLPVSEVLLATGFILVIIGTVRGASGSTGATVLGAGVAAISLGAAEICWREHVNGFRSHVLFLALLPVVLLHTGLRVAIGTEWAGPVPILVDIAVFATLSYWLLMVFRRKTRAGSQAKAGVRARRPRG